MTRLLEAADDFLAYVRHQQPYLKGGNFEGAAYVGRRLDHAWRRLDHLAGRWVEQTYQESLDGSDAREDLDRAVARAGSAAPLDGDARDLNVVAGRHLDAAATFVADLRAALGPSEGESQVRTAAIALHLARRSFSAYRVAKYRWFEHGLGRRLYEPQAGYRWLEA